MYFPFLGQSIFAVCCSSLRYYTVAGELCQEPEDFVPLLFLGARSRFICCLRDLRISLRLFFRASSSSLCSRTPSRPSATAARRNAAAGQTRSTAHREIPREKMKAGSSVQEAHTHVQRSRRIAHKKGTSTARGRINCRPMHAAPRDTTIQAAAAAPQVIKNNRNSVSPSSCIPPLASCKTTVTTAPAAPTAEKSSNPQPMRRYQVRRGAAQETDTAAIPAAM